MDTLSDPALKLKYTKSKLKVKRWESEFKKNTGNNPSKDDIKAAPCEIREAYKWYWQIKIHAIGQDSMLDATFVEPRKVDIAPPTSSFEEKPVNSSTVVEGLPSCEDPSQTFKIPHRECPREEPPLEVKSVLHGTKEELVESNKSVEEPSDSLPTSVWGTHLNKEKSVETSSQKKGLNRASSSFHLSEKLFVGAKLKKRNPRKSLSFSVGRSKERGSLVSSDSLTATPDSSFSLDNSQALEDGFSVSDLETQANMQLDLNLTNQDFKLVKKDMPSGMKNISAVQKLIEDNISSSKPKLDRSVDKGWLERVLQADQILSQEAKENINVPSVELMKSDSGPSTLSAVSDDSDDDIIYGSDNESKSPRKVEKEEKARLALRPTVPRDPPPPVSMQSSADAIKTEHVIDTSENHVKKRKLDAIEAAMAVLSERRKNDRNLSQPKKKLKRSEPIAEGKDVDSNLKAEDGLKDSDSAGGGKKSSKSALSKKDVLEKKVATGSANDNFVRINMKKKVFVRGKKTMNFQKYKKQQWKNKKKELSDQASVHMSRMDPSDGAAGGGLQKCFQCGDVGHFARQCTKMKGDSLMPLGEGDDVEESPFPSLEEVEKMAKEKGGLVHLRSRNAPLSQANSVTKTLEESNQETLDGESPLGDNQDIQEASIMQEPVREPERIYRSVEPLYSTKPDGSLIDTPAEVYECLHKFGHEKFRPGQEAAVMRILSGLSTLVTLSTGSGKSLCYQLPAYLFATKRKCLTLVVSPLVSLMDDQISGLPSFINGAALHTGQTEKQREKVMDMAREGKLQFLLVSPEAVVSGERQSGFGKLLRSLPDIAFACIDEAHCVSQWSHNFRPSYLVIFKVLREKLGVQTILGLTATATQTAVSSIIEHMQIPDGRLGVIQDTPLPNNLVLSVSRDSIRDQALVKLLSSPEYQTYQSIIVYCIRREECERLAGLLRTYLKDQNEIKAGKVKISSVSEAYHAGLSSARRKQVQTSFMSGNTRIVVATVAFGMGINKADIRSVIHFNMPRNFESYVQEVGRAGRDGEVSRCHLFLNNEGKDLNELRRHIFGDSVDRHTIRKLLQRVFVPCKCNKSTTKPSNIAESSDDKREGTNEETALSDPVTEDSKACTGHEVAFSVEETVAALDLPEENITTLLCYLELHDRNLIQVMPRAYTHCKVQSYKGIRHLREVARTCPPLAMAIAMEITSGESQKSSPTIEFPVVEIASAIGWDSGIVKRELMNLEWTKVNGSSRRSGIKVEFSNLGFRLKTPGNLSPEKLDAALDFLHDRVVKQEQSALRQLQTIFKAVTSVSFPHINAVMSADDEEIESKSNNLKSVVRAYFQGELDMTEELIVEEKLENGDQIANDIRQLVSMYKECSFTGRAVARIFHGIGSPNFSPMVWGRCRFWRAHLDSDFKLLCLLATRVLLKMR
ncbi:ATP-dependent DNA helicase Q4 isoform X2 [Thrips palmi]|uniref:DNA 3'-5' helicase n=1 Tax=Thrips palmi TaxID=161013 RepID=A0A6P9ACF7_THRPL|nr:ATP-dependent DNA helicase Q4 isoform X2 [Thrips palmi]